METTAPCDLQQPSAKMHARWHVSRHKNHVHTDLPSDLFRAVPQSYLRSCLSGYRPHLPQIKLNSQLPVNESKLSLLEAQQANKSKR